jgi:hypothetical protein
LISRQKHVRGVNFTHESLELKVQSFESIQREVHASISVFIGRIETEFQAPFQRGIRPIDSPAAFFSQLRDILLFTRFCAHDDPDIDYGKIKALFPGPFPGLAMSSVHYGNDPCRLCCAASGDPLDMPLYGVEDRDQIVEAGWD